ncbi:hypothetical protein EYV94_10585 [Puteibacter caeruleilacunae]|nr:hypothetical protein EYV94_10585 [Puteibacter caeruleilacunae]
MQDKTTTHYDTNQSITVAIQEYQRSHDMTNTLEQRWISKYLLLVDFKRQHGHADVPARYKNLKTIGYWVRRQRLVHTKGKLDPGRESLLKLIGFNFRLLDMHDWNKMYAKLNDFKVKFGHAHITESCEDTQLHNWLVYQRKLYWKGKLEYSKIERLKNLGVDMRNKTLNYWENKYAELVEFKEEHGHLYVAGFYGANEQLLNFVKVQRRNQDTMSPERKRLLNDIGFIWDPKKTTSTRINKERGYQHWFTRFDELKAYKEEYGTSFVSTLSKTHSSLGKWIAAQKWKHKELSQEQIALLEEVDFFKDNGIE